MTQVLVVVLGLLAPHLVFGDETNGEPRDLLRRAKLTAAPIVGAQAKRGEVKAALKWADGQKSPTRKALALLGVGEGILERVNGVKRQDNICRKGRALESEWFPRLSFAEVERKLLW